MLGNTTARQARRQGPRKGVQRESQFPARRRYARYWKSLNDVPRLFLCALRVLCKIYPPCDRKNTHSDQYFTNFGPTPLQTLRGGVSNRHTLQHMPPLTNDFHRLASQRWSGKSIGCVRSLSPAAPCAPEHWHGAHW